MFTCIILYCLKDAKYLQNTQGWREIRKTFGTGLCSTRAKRESSISLECCSVFRGWGKFARILTQNFDINVQILITIIVHNFVHSHQGFMAI
jgi:hypothetical protein